MKKLTRLISCLLLVCMCICMLPITSLADDSVNFVYSQSATTVSTTTGGTVTFEIAFPKNIKFSSATVGLNFKELTDKNAELSVNTKLLDENWTCFNAKYDGKKYQPMLVVTGSSTGVTFSENQPIMRVEVSIPSGIPVGTYNIYALPCIDAYKAQNDPWFTAPGVQTKVMSLAVTNGTEATSYTVTYDANGGSVTPASEVVTAGSSTTLPLPTRAYYNFKYWADNAVHYNANAQFTPSASVTLVAQWEEKPLREAPSVTTVTASSDTAADGKILGTNTTMEWSTSKDGPWTQCSGSQITGLKKGTYYIRYRENSTDKAGKIGTAEILVGTVKVTGVTLNKSTLSLKVGGSETLVATVLPSNATNKNVTWSSSDPSVATVDSNGKVTAKAEGTTTITVTTADGNKTATCTVTVTAAGGGGGGGGGTVVPVTPPKPAAGGYKDCPRDATCPIEPFKDTKNDFWWHDGIHYCVENALMNGFPDGTFQPNGTTTRAQIVTILWRLEGEPASNYAMSFKDVPSGQWYTDAIRWAQSTGVVEGYSAEAFGPDDPITREQMATILYRYAKYHGINVANTNALNGYSDKAQVSSWALDAMKWANSVGLVQGRTVTTLVPGASIIRAEAAAMIQRYCEKVCED